MTVQQAISRVDMTKSNAVDEADKIRWLSQLDGKVYNNVIKTHESATVEEFNGYTDEDMTKELLIGSPYDDVYEYWLEAHISYANKEYTAYNNALLLYNSAYTEFASNYNREHMPKQAPVRRFQ